ncbi:MAG: DUF3037 domain-containing protein [Allorhizobium sp.]
MERIFEYAVIRVIPYAHRGEQLNIGIVVFLPSGIEIRIRESSSILRAFGLEANSFNWLHGYMERVDDPLKTSRERWAALQRGAGFCLSEIGWFSAYEDVEYSLQIEEIIKDYVDRPSTPPRTKRRSSLLRELKTTFQLHDILGKRSDDLDRHKIVSNTPIGPAGKLHIDFLLRNGYYHATETIDFRSSEEAGIAELKDAALASVTLRYAREQLGANSTKCYLVYAAPPLVEKAVQPALSLVENNVDRTFNLDSQEDKKTYIDCMLEAAGNISFI